MVFVGLFIIDGDATYLIIGVVAVIIFYLFDFDNETVGLICDSRG